MRNKISFNRIIITTIILSILSQAAISKENNIIELDQKKAILMVLENNSELKVEKINPFIFDTFIEEEKAQFDYILDGELGLGSDSSKRTLGNSADFIDIFSNSFNFQTSLSKKFDFGSSLSVNLSSGIDARNWEDRNTNQNNLRLGLDYNHPLLRGRGEVNLVKIKQNIIDKEISEYELKGLTISLISQTEKVYWDYVIAKKELFIFEESLKLSENYLIEINERIKIGILSPLERAATKAEIAKRMEDLINAEVNFEKKRLQLILLLNPKEKSWDTKFLTKETIEPHKIELEDINTHIRNAIKNRPEINQALLKLKKGELEVIKTENGLLPKIDLFITLGKTGYSNSFLESFPALFENNYDISANLKFNYPFGNRGSKEINKRSNLNKTMFELALKNLKQLIQLDIRTAYLEVNRTYKQLNATKLSKELQKEKLKMEQEKFKQGISTSFLVSQAQRDLMISKITHSQAIINYLKSITDFYRLEGTILEKRNIII